jgi:hypothetical protein
MTPPVHDHDVTKLYREGSADEPPAALDRAIVRAARESIAPAREARKPWWRRFALPLQLALSVVLVTMLALTVDRNPPGVPAVTERTEPQQAPVSAPHKAAPGGVDPAAGESSAASPAPEARARLPASIESRPSSPKADRKAEAPPAVLPVPGRSDRDSAEKAAAENAAAPAGRRSLEAARPGPAAAGVAPGAAPSNGAPAASRDAAARSPSDWLAAIERLAGKEEKSAARAELEAFRKAYPDYLLPEKLEKLLAP